MGIGGILTKSTSRSLKGENKENVLKGLGIGCCCWNLEKEDS